MKHQKIFHILNHRISAGPMPERLSAAERPFLAFAFAPRAAAPALTQRLTGHSRQRRAHPG